MRWIDFGMRAIGTLAMASTFLAAGAAAQTVTGVSGAGERPEREEFLFDEFMELDDIRESWTNAALFPYRPMAITPGNGQLYAVNAHDSTVRLFDYVAGNPAISTWQTAWGPVAVAIWDGHSDGIGRLLVVTRGTHALSVLDRMTGDVLELIDLPHEPADIVVDDATDRAFVSCSGAGKVVQIDLATLATTEYSIPALDPTYLSLDGAGNVLVAPMRSGNNSTVIGGFVLGRIVIDLADPAFSPDGLPDEDMFRIDPDAGTVEAVLRGTGTLLFAHGINPSTGNLWQLGIEAKNKDLAKQSEPLLKGDFADNRLTITSPSAPGAAPNEVHTFVNLDDADPATAGVQFDPLRTVGMPMALGFSNDGFAYVAGTTTDNVTILGPSGANGEGTWLFEWDLPEGSIPRQVMLDPATDSVVLVYCMGTNKIEAYSVVGAPIATLDVGYDPTPELEKRGREIFFDAAFSEHNNSTCGTCHVEGRADQIAWNLSDLPRDNKGPMVTQSLVGIDMMAPYHWRGERPGLEQFNGAFPGLLGHTGPLDETPGGDFDAFRAFVFSMRDSANPFQDENRIVNDAIVRPQPNGVPASAVVGQQKYATLDSDGNTCLECHSFPSGSNNDLILEIPARIPQQTHIETTHLIGMWRKEQPLVPVTILGNPQTRPLIGFGLLHDGSFNSLFEFVDGVFGNFDDQDVSDVVAFVEQWPAPMAPVAHEAVLLDADHLANHGRIRTYLQRQAHEENGDLVVFGVYPDGGGGLRELSWLYRPGTRDFVADDSGVAPVTLADFLGAAEDEGAWNVFMGVPPGNGELYGLDRDLDDLPNEDEVALGTDPLDPDSDGDGFFDGHEVANGGDPTNQLVLPADSTFPTIQKVELEWVTATNARVTFLSDEPTLAEVTYQALGEPPVTVSETGRLRKVHNIVLTDLLPSTFGPGVPPGFEVFADYTGTITVTDAANRQASTALPGFTTLPFIIPGAGPPVTVTSELGLSNVLKDTVGGTMTVTLDFGNDLKLAGPPAIPAPNMVPIGNVLVDGVVWSSFTAPNATSFDVNGDPFTAMPGPFVIGNPTDANGESSVTFTVTGLAGGETVSFNTIGVFFVEPDDWDPLAPDFGGAGNPLPSSNWSFADSPPDLRAVETTF